MSARQTTESTSALRSIRAALSMGVALCAVALLLADPGRTWLMIIGLMLVALGMWLAGRDRTSREAGPMRAAWLLVSIAGVASMIWMVVALLATDGPGSVGWLAAGSLLMLGIGPVVIAAALRFPGPLPGTSGDRRLILVDTCVAAMAAAVLMGLVLGGRDPGSVLVIGRAAVAIVVMAVVVYVAARARTSGGLPYRQLRLLLAGSCGFVVADTLFLWSAAAGQLQVLLMAASVSAVALATIRPSVEAEERSDVIGRQRMAVIAPLIPVSAALVTLAWAAAQSPELAGWARVLMTLALIGFIVSVIVWRVLLVTEGRSRVAGRARSKFESATTQPWFQAMVAEMPDLLSVTDPGGAVLYQTPAVGRGLGFEPGHWRDRPWTEMVVDGQVERARQAMAEATRASGTAQVGVDLRTRGGGVRHTETTVTALTGEDGLNGYVIVCRDVTDLGEAPTAGGDAVDTVTGLPLVDRMREELELSLAGSPAGRSAVLDIDLDGFAGLRHSYGPEVGDAVLQKVAQAIHRCVRPWDLVARVSDGEFLVAVLGSNAERSVARVFDRLRRQLASIVLSDGQEVLLRLSAGYAINTAGSEDAQDLMRNARLAMARARTSQRVELLRFEPEMHEHLVSRVTAEQKVRAALTRRQLHLAYQPIVELASGRVCGFEALARWDDPEGGEVVAADFVPLVEELGLAAELGEWVIRQACRDVEVLRRAGLWSDGLVMNINISGRHLDDSLVEHVTSALSDTGVPARDLVIEVTESSVAANIDEVRSVLEHLREVGCQVALDDFGTGYSSLSYLANVPVDVLKIDRTFIAGLTDSPELTALTRTIVALAQALGLVCIGEGVETAEQARLLVATGCQQAQGYHFSWPLTLAELIDQAGRAPQVGYLPRQDRQPSATMRR